MANPNHDERGRFASGSGGGRSGPPNPREKWSERQKAVRELNDRMHAAQRETRITMNAIRKSDSAPNPQRRIMVESADPRQQAGIDAAYARMMAGKEFTRTSDARGKDQPTSKKMQIGDKRHQPATIRALNSVLRGQGQDTQKIERAINQAKPKRPSHRSSAASRRYIRPGE